MIGLKIVKENKLPIQTHCWSSSNYQLGAILKKVQSFSVVFFFSGSFFAFLFCPVENHWALVSLLV
jgi:hypothetical protein